MGLNEIETATESLLGTLIPAGKAHAMFNKTYSLNTIKALIEIYSIPLKMVTDISVRMETNNLDVVGLHTEIVDANKDQHDMLRTVIDNVDVVKSILDNPLASTPKEIKTLKNEHRIAIDRLGLKHSVEVNDLESKHESEILVLKEQIKKLTEQAKTPPERVVKPYKVGQRKFTDEQVKSLRKSTESSAVLAKMHNVSVSTIDRMLSGVTYKNC